MIAQQIRNIFAIMLLAALTTICSGCNVLGFAAQAVGGENPKPALFKMDKKAATVVVAENFDNPAQAALDAEPLARFTNDQLRANSVVPTIDPSKIYTLQQSNSEKYRALTIAAVGRAVSADQVLYIEIVNVSVRTDPGTDLFKGDGEVRVKVIDTKTGATVWPLDEAGGHRVLAETRLRRTGENGQNELTTRNELARELANKVAQLFYERPV